MKKIQKDTQKYSEKDRKHIHNAMKEITDQPRTLHLAKILCKNKGKIKPF